MIFESRRRFSDTPSPRSQAHPLRCRASSSTVNSSSSRGLTIRCRTMTARFDCWFRLRSSALKLVRHTRFERFQSCRGCRMESSRDMNTVGGTGTSRNRSAMKGEGCQRACHLCFSAACYIQRMEPSLHSGLVGRPPAMLEKRIPINPVTDIPHSYSSSTQQR